MEAIGVEADCVEAIYNLGQVNLKMDLVAEAHQAFDKLFSEFKHRSNDDGKPELYHADQAFIDRFTLEAAMQAANVIGSSMVYSSACRCSFTDRSLKKLLAFMRVWNAV